jgi:hypothetical protein
MQSVKLSVTCRAALETRYDAKAMKRIDEAIARWIAADAARGIRTVHLALDDTAAMKPWKVKAVPNRPTARQVKRALDALVARLSPDYIVLVGSGDVIPHFEVPNPSLNEADGDTDPLVPTDNPYASSQPFDGRKRKSYLVPDRVVGRIPDLPGSDDPRWLTDYLGVATKWVSRPARAYAKDLMVCCDSWRDSGKECARYISRDVSALMISPPAGTTSRTVRGRHAARLQMIKVHGAELDSGFYGQKGNAYPEVLRSSALLRRTKRTTVVGAMCCYGASVFDPDDEAAVNPGEAPIPSVFLRQGAYGFLGSTCTAWVGPDTMMCADWIVATFLKSVLAGASIGRATLEAKQDFVRWNEQQGDVLDTAEEKTLLQFVLLGDPSIHPVVAAAPAALATASMLGAAPQRSIAVARKQRRALRHELGAVLRGGIPVRRTVSKEVPPDVRAVASRLADEAGAEFKFRMSAPRVQKVSGAIARPEYSPVAARGAARAMSVVAGARGTATVERTSYQYYWTARHRTQGAPVEEIRLVSVQADAQGNVMRTRLMVSSGSPRRRRSGGKAEA